MENNKLEHRRLLLKFLAASPLLSLGMPSFSTGTFLSHLDQNGVIRTPSQALNVFDFQRAAKAKLSPAHYGYLETGVLDDRTILENREAFSRIKLKMRRLTGIENVDMSVELFGDTWPSPLFLCPCGSQKAFHPDGEIATAKAAKAENHLQLLSTMSTSSIEEVTGARGAPVWFQLYPTKLWDDNLLMIRKAEEAGSRVLVLTVDMDHADRRETYIRARRIDDTQKCQTCHGRRSERSFEKKKPIIKQLKENYQYPAPLTWNYVKKIKESTEMKLVLKGLVAGEDASIALDNGIDGVIVSNHGGKASESGRATVDSLEDVANAIQGKIPVMMDGGIRRGKDIFKALARGATAVGIGSPYLWGLASFGQPGVEMVLKMLKAELELAMKQTGVRSLAEISKTNIVD